MAETREGEHPQHSDEYKQQHPHIHTVKYKGKGGKEKIYTYRYGEIKERRRKSPLEKARED